jgi:peptide/nickel transport system permease protein
MCCYTPRPARPRAEQAVGEELLEEEAQGEPPLLSVSDLSIAFLINDEERLVVSDVDLAIRAGESVGIVGESGCGKSSVARAIARLLPRGGEVVDGSITFDGQDVIGKKDSDLYAYRRHSVSYVAQDPMTALDPTLRIGVLLRRIVQASDGLSRKQADARVLELLEQVKLPDPAAVAKSYPHELSGGMAQRVGIARAVATRPRLLIADEPTTALDVTVQAGILALLRSLQKELGMALLLVSHDWGVVAQVCDRALVMYGGELVESGRLRDVAGAPLHPYTAALLACRPSNVIDDDAPLPTITGSVLAPGNWPTGCRFSSRCAHRADDCDVAPIPISLVTAGHRARCLYPLHEVGDQKELTVDV